MPITFPDAKREFSIRYYSWAGSEYDRHISESFADLRSFKSGSVWELYHFMQLLTPGEQKILASSLLKRFHPDAVKALDESCTADENVLRDRRDNFFRIRGLYKILHSLEKMGEVDEARNWFRSLRSEIITVLGDNYWSYDENLRFEADTVFAKVPMAFDEEIAARLPNAPKIKFASKAKLRKAVLNRFKAEFENQCFDLALVGLDPELDFKMKICGWIINTHFEFNGKHRQIWYSHSIQSPTRSDFSGTSTMTLAYGLSFTSWLGISSQTQWEYLIPEEIDPASNAIIALCRRFFDAAPKLLKGLEFENISDPLKIP